MAILARYDYGTAAPTDQHGLAWLEKMNCLRACIDIEMTYPITEWGQPNQRMSMFTSQWIEGTMLLATRQLDALGLSGGETNLSDGLMFTGTSLSRKQSREQETDRVAGKFPRDFGASPRAPSVTRKYSAETIFDPNA